MSLSLPIKSQFLEQSINKTCFLYEGFKTTNESSSIPRENLSLGILIQFYITNDIFQYPRIKY